MCVNLNYKQPINNKVCVNMCLPMIYHSCWDMSKSLFMSINGNKTHSIWDQVREDIQKVGMYTRATLTGGQRRRYRMMHHGGNINT